MGLAWHRRINTWYAGILVGTDQIKRGKEERRAIDGQQLLIAILAIDNPAIDSQQPVNNPPD